MTGICLYFYCLYLSPIHTVLSINIIPNRAWEVLLKDLRPFPFHLEKEDEFRPLLSLPTPVRVSTALK